MNSNNECFEVVFKENLISELKGKKILEEGIFDNFSWKDWGHLSLDAVSIAASLFPGVGSGVSVVADLANAAWYMSEGKTVTAGLYALMAIPFVGDIFAVPILGALKLGGKGLSKIPGASKLFDKIISNSSLIRKFIEKLFNTNLTKPAGKALEELLESAIKIESKEGAEAAAKWFAVQEAKLLKESAGTSLGAKITDYAASRMIKSSKVALKRVIPKTAGAIFDPEVSAPSPEPGPSPEPEPGPTPKPGPRKTWRKCPDTMLKVGCRGENVRKVQQKLLDCGYSLPRYGVDGKFKYETKSAVEALQRASNIKVDGIVGSQTLAALESCKPNKVDRELQPEVSPVGKEEISTGPGFLERTFQEVEKMKSTPASNKLMSRGDAERQWAEDEERFKNFKADIGESKINGQLNIISNRNSSLEKLVFERLIKNEC